jgi:hypothetical protein
VGETKQRNRAAWRAFVASRYPDHTPEEALRDARLRGDGLGEEPGIPGHDYATRAASERQDAARCSRASWSRAYYADRARGWIAAAREEREWSMDYHGPLLAGMEVSRG